MTKSEIPVMPQFFDRYINLADNMLILMDALTQASDLWVLFSRTNA